MRRASGRCRRAAPGSRYSLVGLIQHHAARPPATLRRKPNGSRRAPIQVPVGLLGLAMNTMRVSSRTARRHGVEIVAEIACRHFDARGARGLCRQRVHRERMLRVNRRRARRKKGTRRHFEHVVRAIAEHDALLARRHSCAPAPLSARNRCRPDNAPASAQRRLHGGQRFRACARAGSRWRRA